MAKITYNVEDAEPFEGGEQAPAGIYTAEVVQATHRTEKRDGSEANDIEIALKLVDHEYSWVFTYIGLNDASAGRLRELTNALGLKPKGTIDTDKLVGKKLKVKINPDTYNDEYRARAGRLMSLSGDDEPAEEPDEPAEEPAAEGGGGDEDFIPTREDEQNSYDAWEDDELEAEVEDRELTVPGGRGAKKTKWIKALRADDEEAAGSGGTNGNGDAADADSEQPEDDYETADDGKGWTLEELTAEIHDRELQDQLPKGRKGKKALIEILRKDNADNPF